MRSVVEEAGADGVLEIDDIQRGGVLIEIVPIAARIKADQRTEEHADHGFVRDDEHAAALVFAHDVHGTGGARPLSPPTGVKVLAPWSFSHRS